MGWVSVALGVAGIFLPVLPTTPFILLASWCFARSSDRFHQWLIQHPKLGPLISMWQSGQGIPKRARNRAVFAIAAGMTLSALIVGKLWITLMLAVIGSSVSFYLFRLPLASEDTPSSEQ
ncbi:MAG: YbaN family protein [Agarilytica sp.]